MANSFRFKGVIAVRKVVRNDLLIALHLTLDMVRDCCVLGMMLRDRAEGASYHCEGGIGNQFVADLRAIQQSRTASGFLGMILESSTRFDEKAAQWSDAYAEHRQALLDWMKRARMEQSQQGTDASNTDASLQASVKSW